MNQHMNSALNYNCITQVLGVPVDSVYEKLAKDPMMTKTFDLGNQEHFNDDFKKAEEKFTYLVPTDKAWEEIQQEMATAHKVSFSSPIYFCFFGLEEGLPTLLCSTLLTRFSSWVNSSTSQRRY